MLEVAGIGARYGAVRALSEVSLDVRPGEVVALVGANGAGKSTLLNVLSGLVPADGGRILFEGTKLSGLAPARIVRRGLVQVPEGRQIFADLTVAENLEVASYGRSSRDGIAGVRDLVLTLFPRLGERLEQRAGLMSGGEQQMLAIGRALMSGPRLLLLDEPSMGLAPRLVAEIFRALRALNRESGIAMLLVEQNAHAALRLSGRGYVLASGRIVREGASNDLLDDPEMRAAYLGRSGSGVARSHPPSNRQVPR